jgi:hypothetical protein
MASLHLGQRLRGHQEVQLEQSMREEIDTSTIFGGRSACKELKKNIMLIDTQQLPKA